MNLYRSFFLTLLLICHASFLPPTEADEQAEEFFEKRIRPILVERCYECHSGTKTSGGLSLEFRQGWQKGGESGPAIVPGRPQESLLIEAINYRSLEMPPPDGGGKLTAAQIADLTTWIERGAADPRDEHALARIGGMDRGQAARWWAFQPLPPAQQHPTPADIDAFVNAQLAANGVTASGSADKRTLIRRATYALTGLPPTPEEVDAFVNDAAPDAFAQLVDRLLESPAYGEHWGRHWLDVVRYADTAGENTDRPLPHAWRYRNWVFQALQADMPFDEFVRLQIAGDLIRAGADPPRRSEGIIATGYLAVARRFGHDIDKDIHLMHEDVIDNLGKNFLGLTLGCARCHDHKYDPISSRDYYALYGIFDSTRFSFPGCEPQGQPRDLIPLLSAGEIEALLQPWRERVATREAEQKRREMLVSTDSLKQLASTNVQVLAQANVLEGASESFANHQHPLRATMRKGEVLQLIVNPNGNHGADSTLVEWTITRTDSPAEADENNVHPTGNSTTQWSVQDLIDSLTTANPHVIDSTPQPAAWCFLEVTDGPLLLSDKKEAVLGHSELKAWSLGDVPSVFVNSADSPVQVWTTLPPRSFFVHPGPNRPVAVAWICPQDGTFEITGRVADAHPTDQDGVSFVLQQIANSELGPQLLQFAQLQQTPLSDPGPAPPIPVAYAVTEASAHNVPLQLRGDPQQLGEIIDRRWLEIFGSQPVPSNGGSGRKELAEWMVHNPLLVRVMVNRIWQWHFGQGLVRTPNDFGARGEPPTHPELLEWLAAQFAANRYQLKPLHRLIMNSEAWQRASTSSSELTLHDPTNRWLARFPRRRLSAEEIRDSLLLVAGRLDRQPGEAHPFPDESTWNFTQHNPFNAVYDSNKRSMYLMVQRQRRHPFLALFDGADPNASTPARQTTTTATQALYFMNDPFFHQQASAVAQRLDVANTSDAAASLVQLYRLLLQRAPTPHELERGLQFLQEYQGTAEEAWTGLARVLLASNEFIYVD